MTLASTRLAALLGCCLLPAAGALAQAYPVKAVRIVVPFPTGGSTDLVARALAGHLSESWKQPVLVDNRPGAGGSIGSEVAAKAPADGYTLLVATVSTHAIVPHLYPKLGYDPLRDFAPITEMATVPNLLVVHPSLPVKTVRDLVALARKQPGVLNFASNGNGTNNHLAGEMLMAMTGVRMQHVPYKGSAFAMSDLVGGHVSLMFDVIMTAMPMVKAGKVRPIAVAAPRRSPLLPDVPTVAESGGLADFEVTVWFGLWAPAATPPDTLARVHAETIASLRTPRMQEFFQSQGAEIVGSTPQQFALRVRQELERWGRIVRAAQVRLD